MNREKIYFDIAIIGGGASGLTSAVTILRESEKRKKPTKIAVLEKNSRIGKKLLQTGNGRCNMTHLPLERERLHGDLFFINKILDENVSVTEFFESLGVITRTDDMGNVYPYSNTAATVLDSLRQTIECYNNANVYEEYNVIRIEPLLEGFLLTPENDELPQIAARRLIFSCGGMNERNNYLIKNHEITPPVPILAPISTDTGITRSIKGLRVKCEAKAILGGEVLKAERGEVIFGEGKLSGIAIFNLSRLAAIHGENLKISLDLMPDHTHEFIVNYLNRMKKLREKAEDMLSGILPKRIGTLIMKISASITLTTPTENITGTDIEKIAKTLKNWEFPCSYNPDPKTAQCTMGGIKTEELRCDLSSKKMKHLFFTGEAIDIDGDCGGYNLTWAFISGIHAGKGVLKSLEENNTSKPKAAETLIIRNIKIPPDKMSTESLFLRQIASKSLRINEKQIIDVKIHKKSLDARKKHDVHFSLSLIVSLKTKYQGKLPRDVGKYTETGTFSIPNVYSCSNIRPVIVGSGPAGLFSALILARAGLNPIILERGECMDERIKSVHTFETTRTLNENSNIQFGEGGAGTFSDGKLNTGTNSPYTRFILEEFHKHGAPADILYESKPHIGTDILINTVKSIRNEIITLGGKFLFSSLFENIHAKNNTVSGLTYRDLKTNIIHEITTDKIILAIGHSARDTFYMLHENNISLVPKPFSVGVRIEHLQSEINRSLYGNFADSLNSIDSGDYKLSTHIDGRGVYSFCMCPGGFVVAAASEKNTVVTNGMSNRNRDNVNANSAILVSVTPSDYGENWNDGINFQREIERKAFIAGGSNYGAPVFLVGDFLEKKISEKFGKVHPTYKPDVKIAPPDEYLPPFITEALRKAIPIFSSKISAFAAPDAIITGAETRSSSPLRIVRDELLMSVSLKNLYPIGEGAGYAGGIMSAAADGVKTALKLIT